MIDRRVRWFRKLICWLIGHRSICLYSFSTWEDDSHNQLKSQMTGWKCTRCGHTFTEQWDT